MDKKKVHKFTTPIVVTKVIGGVSNSAVIPMASEIPFTIFGNNIKLTTLMCSPSDLEELAIGFLFNAGIISGISDFVSCQKDDEKMVYNISFINHLLIDEEASTGNTNTLNSFPSGNAVYTFHEMNLVKQDSNHFSIEKEKISAAMSWFKKSLIYEATKGVHSSTLSEKGEIPEKIFEDVARHNVIDKVVGNALMKSYDTKKSLLFCSCRISTEIVQKAGRCSIPFVVSFHSPTHQAILLAEKLNMTIIGNMTVNNFIIYTNPQRVI